MLIRAQLWNDKAKDSDFSKIGSNKFIKYSFSSDFARIQSVIIDWAIWL